MYPIRRILHLCLERYSISKLEKVCLDYSPDLVYTNVGVVDIGFRLAKKLGVPHVYHLREYQDKDFGMKIIPSIDSFKKSLNECHSICITRGIQSHFGLNDNNSRAIYDGVRHENAVYYNSDKERYFLFVGRLEAAKGFDLVLRSFAEFCKVNSEYQLKVLGAPTTAVDAKSNFELIESLSIANRVELLGVSNEVDKYMQRATAVVMASRSEGFGLVTVEAMYNGCLVIGRNTAGTKEQFDNGVAVCGEEIGLRFDNEDDLVQHMLDVVANGTEYYREMVKRSQRVVSKLYSIESCSEQIYTYFNQILAIE